MHYGNNGNYTIREKNSKSPCQSKYLPRISFSRCRGKGDNGPGFPKTMMAETFSNFIPGIIHHDMHTGLNLQYAYMIMRILRGDLQISNDPEGGAVVKLIFMESA